MNKGIVTCRTPSKVKLVKLCINCYNTDLFNNVLFITNIKMQSYYKGDICKECYPLLLPKYEQWLIDEAKLRKYKQSKEYKESIISTVGYNKYATHLSRSRP